ncbi:expansin EXLX1 family cellulose-binding protein [Pseudofrankia saprophytica]|uniref:expansin EXLX1 family cellulose-binding protein n=1 Tax=Pseudofrankia saprophytica TaxID=298655 RepID=UPI0006849B7E|nr:expansin EXLX1 family cellulose-binding protein [Pseudofrankia saprophytica]
MASLAVTVPARRTLLGLATAAFAVAIAGCQPAAGGGPAQPAATGTQVTSPASTATTALPTAPAVPATTAPSPSASPSATPSRPTRPTTATPAPPPPTTRPAPAPVPAGAGRIRPGVVYSGPATHYDADGGGNCMFDRLNDPAMPVVAMNELDYENARACGAYIEVTGPGGSTVVKVTDRCPECGAGHVDLSPQAFERIAGGVPGQVNVTWRLVSPASIGSVQYQIKDGSSAYWLAIQVRNHRNPIVSLEVRVNGSWVALGREMWNYFVAPQGLGPGPFTVRITDLYGEQLVHTVNLAPTTVQTTNSQFAQH